VVEFEDPEDYPDIDTMIKALESELKGISITPPTPTPTAVTPIPTPETDIEKKEPEVDYISLFQTLNKKLFDRDFDLGESFDKNITFESYSDNTLTWKSTAHDEDRKRLITHWGLIKYFVKDIFGIETKIVNIPMERKKEKTIDAIQEMLDSASMNDSNPEDRERESICIAHQAEEREPNSILEEPMVKDVIERFDPTKVRIINKS